MPPLLHMHFRTSNVLVDENFMAKVSDYGLYKLLIDGDLAESSSMTDCFLDPEYVVFLRSTQYCILDYMLSIYDLMRALF